MPETNEHLWFCPNLLIPIFNKYHSVLKFLITSNSESLPTLFTDAIRFCWIFSWTNNPPRSISDAPDLHYILLNLIPNELIHPFKAAKIGKKLTKKLLITFLFDLHQDIYNTIWRERTTRWKEWKKGNHITEPRSKITAKNINTVNNPSLITTATLIVITIFIILKVILTRLSTQEERLTALFFGSILISGITYLGFRLLRQIYHQFLLHAHHDLLL